MILGKFFEVVLPNLTTPQRGEISRSFREGIEDAKSLMDDVALPYEYHSALLELTNAILSRADRRIGRASIAHTFLLALAAVRLMLNLGLLPERISCYGGTAAAGLIENFVTSAEGLGSLVLSPDAL